MNAELAKLAAQCATRCGQLETQNAQLAAALRVCEIELVTLRARLSEPYASNVAKACEIASAALKGVA